MTNDSFEERARNFVAQLSLEEKALQMQHNAPAIERLGLPAYNWWNEGLHGVARAGIATVFPQAIGLAAIWSAPRLKEIADVIATEMRAKHHEFVRMGDWGQYKGLTCWAPNINIFRDPRWGRGHETYGECPYLTSKLGVAFCEGLQGNDETYFKVIATPKHLAVHSGPEADRHSFDAIASEKDLWETYLPAFHACIVEAKAYSVMGAYNRTNGEPCCASNRLLVDVLRNQWHFDGFVVSDCWAVKDFHESHHVTQTKEESAALAVKMGCDLNCGCTYEHLPAAVHAGLLDEAELNTCLERLFVARLRLGLFDAPSQVTYAQVPFERVDCEAHRTLNRRAAQESLVLLKNENGLLPLSTELTSIAVIGPNADNAHVLRANYFGEASQSTTPLAGIRAAVSPHTHVWTTEGCKHTGLTTDGIGRAGNISEALSMAKRSDIVVLCLGLNADIEGEQGDVGNSDTGGDRADLRLTGLQERLMREVTQTGKPVVLVTMAGSPLDLRWANENVGAILHSWYPGAEGGAAIADVLFGRVSPAGRLPVSFPRCTEDLPNIADYSMSGRTYRYTNKAPLYPFGFGLSYSSFCYSDISVSSKQVEACEATIVSARVTNTGPLRADEVVQLYIKHQAAPCPTPHFDLRGFQRISLNPGESATVAFSLDEKSLSIINRNGDRIRSPGVIRLYLGGSQPDARSGELLDNTPLFMDVTVKGEATKLAY